MVADFSKFPQRIKYAEWSLIALTSACQLYWVEIVHGFNGLYALSFLSLALSALCVAVVAEKRWRVLVILLQAALYTLAMATGAFKMYGFLFFILAGKSAFIGTKRSIPFTVAALYFLHLLGFGIGAHLYKIKVQHLPEHLNEGLFGLVGFVEGQLFFLTALIIVALFARTFVAEQRARQQADRLSRELEIMAVSVERGRIARDIHDSVGHSLTSLNIQLELAGRLLGERAIEEAAVNLRDAKELAATALNEVRRAVHAIHEDDFSLAEAVGSLAQRMAEQQAINVNLQVDDSGLSVASRHNLLLITKESLTNIQKHAAATCVQIRLSNDGSKAELAIEDNGKGFQPNDDTEGFGLRGMQERVAALGGTLTVNSAPGRGTSILVSVPN